MKNCQDILKDMIENKKCPSELNLKNSSLCGYDGLMTCNDCRMISFKNFITKELQEHAEEKFSIIFDNINGFNIIDLKY